MKNKKINTLFKLAEDTTNFHAGGEPVIAPFNMIFSRAVLPVELFYT